MHLQNILAVLASLTVVGLSTPVIPQEENSDIIERNEPTAIIQVRYAYEDQEGSKIIEKGAVKAADKIIESSLNRKSIDEPLGIIFPTRVIEQNKRGDETVVWVQPPPTSKIPM
ncbi:hypothetical protein OCU04_003818 [Sclerotinia nivalis]|uniref:Uncharacterized protein n=1 Tax=Sclerotinia nivalis TaxID=352851 RepID=A0A9X0DLQ2_9HELO|nr:hypothetical protein OCU04_003818 [Sclerotinia nivalis]